MMYTRYTKETLPVKHKTTIRRTFNFKGHEYIIFKTNVWTLTGCNPPDEFDCKALCGTFTFENPCPNTTTHYNLATKSDSYGWDSDRGFSSGLRSYKACRKEIRGKYDKRKIRRWNRRRGRKE